MPAAPESLADRLTSALLDPRVASELRVPGRIDAAVLVALYLDGGRLHTVFTRRGANMRRHAGEVSFPGGRRDPSDASLEATALREAHEEIGLDPGSVRVVGALQPTPTIVTGYAIYPFVGLIEAGTAWTLSRREVAAVLELPLDDLSDGYARRRLRRHGLPIRTDTYVVGDNLIWGATARILADLLERVGVVQAGLDAQPSSARPEVAQPDP